jgi:Family of unknown function (DUF6152)
MNSKLILSSCLAIAALMVAAPLLAHHGAAAYDTSKQTTITGKIEDFEFINPHCQLFVDVPDEGGKIVKWMGEFTNPGALHRRGWTKEMFKPGDEITLIGDRARNGAAVLRVQKLKLADGRTMNALGAGDEN